MASGSKIMTTFNDFIKYYKTINNSELLSILDSENEYQPIAVEAAKQELSNRQLSEEEIQIAREPIIEKQIQKEKQKAKALAIEEKVKTAGNTFFDAINPIYSGTPSTEKTIRLIVIIFGGIFLYQFLKNIQAHIAYLKDITRFPFDSIMHLLPLILLPVATFTFWKRKTVGWTLLTIFLTFSAVGAAWLLIQSLNWKSYGLAGLDNLFPRPSLLTCIILLLFFIGTIYVLCKANIREIFFIDKQKMKTTIGISGFVTVVLLFATS